MGQALPRRGAMPRPTTEGERLRRLGGLLARWHCWRRLYTPERGYARTSGPVDPEDELEAMLMNTLEIEIACLPQPWQRMLQQLARAECMGVQTEDTSESAYATVLDHLAHRLRWLGVL